MNFVTQFFHTPVFFIFSFLFSQPPAFFTSRKKKKKNVVIFFPRAKNKQTRKFRMEPPDTPPDIRNGVIENMCAQVHKRIHDACSKLLEKEEVAEGEQKSTETRDEKIRKQIESCVRSGVEQAIGYRSNPRDAGGELLDEVKKSVISWFEEQKILRDAQKKDESEKDDSASPFLTESVIAAGMAKTNSWTIMSRYEQRLVKAEREHQLMKKEKEKVVEEVIRLRELLNERKDRKTCKIHSNEGCVLCSKKFGIWLTHEEIDDMLTHKAWIGMEDSSRKKVSSDEDFEEFKEEKLNGFLRNCITAERGFNEIKRAFEQKQKEKSTLLCGECAPSFVLYMHENCVTEEDGLEEDLDSKEAGEKEEPNSLVNLHERLFEETRKERAYDTPRLFEELITADGSTRVA